MKSVDFFHFSQSKENPNTLIILNFLSLLYNSSKYVSLQQEFASFKISFWPGCAPQSCEYSEIEQIQIIFVYIRCQDPLMAAGREHGMVPWRSLLLFPPCHCFHLSERPIFPENSWGQDTRSSEKREEPALGYLFRKY